MNNLPCEILAKIIEFLPLVEIEKCKEVCVMWRLLIENDIRLRHLVISDQAMSGRKWSFNYAPVDRSNLIKQFSLIDRKLDEPIFKNIRSLYVCSKSFDGVISNVGQMLSKLKRLVRLEMLNLKIREKSCVINLPNLIYLSIQNVNFKAMRLDTPALSHLRMIYNGRMNEIEMSKMIKIQHSTSIKYFESTKYHSAVESFANLEYLACKEIENLPNDFLKGLPNLKAIYLSKARYASRNVFDTLKQQNQQLKRNLKIYYFGIDGLNLDTNSNNELDDGYFSANKKTTKLLCKNYHKLAEHASFIYGLDYSVVEEHFVEIPSDFASKFVDLKLVKVNGKVNSKQLIGFLKNHRCLNELNTENASLTQLFFDFLPRLCPHLNSLSIRDRKKSYDFNFILKFKNLVYCTIEQKLNYEFICQVFKTTKIEEFFFSYHDEFLAIMKQNDVWIYGPSTEEPLDEFETVDEMLESFAEANFYDGRQFEEVDSFDEEMLTDESESDEETDDDDVSLYALTEDSMDDEDEEMSTDESELDEETDDDDVSLYALTEDSMNDEDEKMSVDEDDDE